MELSESSIVIAGATGALGRGLAHRLTAAGAQVGLAGRDPARLQALSDELEAPSARFDARDARSCRTAIDALAAALGGLDAIVVACGAVAFGRAGSLSDETVAELFAVDALGPVALIEAALAHMHDGTVVGVSAVVADHPTAEIAHYSAAKGALSAYLTALRLERRREGVTVLDVRPPHLDTGFESRALSGRPPRLPEPVPAGRVVEAIIEAMRSGARSVAWDLGERALVTR